jgi:hypothetical protein
MKHSGRGIFTPHFSVSYIYKLSKQEALLASVHFSIHKAELQLI